MGQCVADEMLELEVEQADQSKLVEKIAHETALLMDVPFIDLGVFRSQCSVLILRQLERRILEQVERGKKREKPARSKDEDSVLRQRATFEHEWRQKRSDYRPQRDAKKMRQEYAKKHPDDALVSTKDFQNARRKFPLEEYPW